MAWALALAPEARVGNQRAAVDEIAKRAKAQADYLVTQNREGARHAKGSGGNAAKAAAGAVTAPTAEEVDWCVWYQDVL